MSTQQNQTFIRELIEWEQSMRKLDQQIRDAPPSQTASVPPVRSAAAATINPQAFIESKASQKKAAEPPATAPAVSAPPPSTAKVNVKQALQEIRRDVEQESTRVAAAAAAAVPAAAPAKPAAPSAAVSSSSSAVASKTTPSAVSSTTGPALSAASSASSFSGLREQLSHDADEEKERGNALFRQGQYQAAVDAYTQAILMQPSAVLYSNRAMALLKLNDFAGAEKDSSAAVALDETAVKAHGRLAAALEGLGRLSAALAALDRALSLEPHNAALLQHARRLRPLVHAAATTPAVSSPISSPPASSSTATPSSGTSALVKPSAPKQATATVSAVGAAAVVAPPPAAKSSPVTPSSSTLPSSKPSPVTPSSITSPSAKPSPVTHSTAVTPSRAAPKAKRGPSELPSQRLAVRPRVPPAAPLNSFEFEKEWHALRADDASLRQYLQLIPPASYPVLFQSCLTPEIVSDIVRVLGTQYLPANDIAAAVDVLAHLRLVSRSDLLVGFLSDPERAVVASLLSKAPESTDAETLRTLRSAYNITDGTSTGATGVNKTTL